MSGEDVDALFQKGLVLQAMGRVDEAILSLSGALELQPQHVNASYALASCKNSKGEFKEAIRVHSRPLMCSLHQFTAFVDVQC